MLNWCAAPFGTKEYELREYGVEGKHFTREPTAPAEHRPGQKEIADTVRLHRRPPPGTWTARPRGASRPTCDWQNATLKYLEKTRGTGSGRAAGQVRRACRCRPRTRSPTSPRPPAGPTSSRSSTEWRTDGGDEARDFYVKALRDNGRADDVAVERARRRAGETWPHPAGAGHRPQPGRQDGPAQDQATRSLRARLRRDWPLLVMTAAGVALLLVFHYLPTARQRDRLPGLQPVRRRQRTARWVRGSVRNFSRSSSTRLLGRVLEHAVDHRVPAGVLLPAADRAGHPAQQRRRPRLRAFIQGVVYLPHFFSWVLVVTFFVQMLGGAGLLAQTLRDARASSAWTS